MESRGRRASRVAAPMAGTPEAGETAEMKAMAGEPGEGAMEAHQPIEIALEPTESMAAADLAAIPEVALSGGASQSQSPVPAPAAAFERDTLSAWAQSQATLTRALEAMSAEMAGLVLRGVDATASAASKMLGVRTLSDAIAVNAGFTCSSFNAVLGGSARLSELGAKLAAETSQLLLNQFGAGWMKAARSRH